MPKARADGMLPAADECNPVEVSSAAIAGSNQASGNSTRGGNREIADYAGKDLVLTRWLHALRRESPNLPEPIAVAMTQSVARGPQGQSLCRIEMSLVEIENATLADLTGSEVRVLAAILHALRDTAARLEGEIALLYRGQAE